MFRDPRLFQQLREVVLPRLREARPGPLRIWVPGCGTGEDAYSLALELIGEAGAEFASFRIFATDVDSQRIEFARAGAYDEAALERLSEAQRRAYFTPHAGRLRVNEPVRRCVVFARHDLGRDPPFSNVDLIVAGELMSHLDDAHREHAMAAFHYALRSPGFLLVARNEAIAAPFQPLVDGTYVHSGASTLRLHDPEPPVRAALFPLPSEIDLSRNFDRVLMQSFAPPAVLVDDGLTVLQTRGDLTRVFDKAGTANMTLSALVGAGLAGPLARLARRAFTTREAQRGGAFSRAQLDGSVMSYEVWAVPLLSLFESSRSLALVFVPRRAVEVSTVGGASPDVEIDALREHLASLACAHAQATEELASANDELRASIEDLQSLNEELRTSQEQLLSTNDELSEVNEQLALRNRELRQVYGDLSNVFTTCEVPVLILDERGCIRRFSNAALRLINVRDSDVGRPFDDLRVNVDMPELSARVADVIANGGPSEHEVRDREGRWHRLLIRPYHDADGRTDGAVLSLFDIDALKESARRAELASEVAEKANRAKDEFLATLSHELRSPLHAVLVYTQLLRRHGLTGEKLRQAVVAIEGGVSQLVHLLDELLDVSRIESGKFTIHTEALELVEVVSQALEAVAAKCTAKQLRVRVELPGSLRIAGDGPRLQQVVANLLSNAIKFTRAGGSIAVSLEQAEGSARLLVRDDGVGIAADFLPHVFERFSQGDSSFSREFGGLGLGLHIVRQIVEMHGGKVDAHSAGLGQGATFTVQLPLLRELASEPRHVPPVPPLALEGMRILVVDDDSVARAAVSDVLSHAGAEVLAAPSAADAMEAVLECEPQLMVCDIAMPGEDGYSLIRRVRSLEDPALSAIPALALTAFAREIDRDRALSAGYHDHLAKPVDIDSLMRALSTLRARSNAR